MAGGKVLFFADSPKGRGLWISDGTSTGTKMVRDLSASYGGKVTLRYLSPDPAGIRAYFQLSVYVSASFYGYLFVTDGTSAGTKVLVRTVSSSASGHPARFRFLGTKMLFTMKTYREGRELWVTDGTAAGTKLVKDLIPGRSSAYVQEMVPDPSGTKAWFTSRSSTSGYDLWSSDGTALGTKLFVKSLPGKPRFLQPSGGKLFFSLFQSGYGYEPWVSDGTAAGTHRIVDLYPGSRSGYAWYTTELGAGTVAFTSDHPTYGSEICVSSGTAATTKVQDLGTWTLGPVTESDQVDAVTPFFGRLLFLASDGTGTGKHGRELWISDGTAAGTRLVKDVNPGPGNGAAGSLARAGGKVFFTGYDPKSGFELWVTDGTSAGTRLVKDLHPTGSSNPRRLAGIGDKVFFSAWIPGKGEEPCVSDGTAAGTFVLKDIRTGTLGSNPDSFAGLPGKVLFAANRSGTTGNELWITDGTAAGTKLLKDINPGIPGSDPAFLTLFRGKVVFRATHFKYGPELWISDFSSTGTVLLKDLIPGTTGGNPFGIQDVAGRLFFLGDVPTRASVLWSSDGTAAGTGAFLTMPGNRGGYGYLTGVGSRRMYFTSLNHPTQGDELAYFDLKTKKITDLDLLPGSKGSGPHNVLGRDLRFAVLGGGLFFSATRTPSPGADMQLCRIDNGATTHSVGDVLGPAQLWAEDPVLGATAKVTTWSGKSLPILVLLLGLPAADPIPILGGFRSFLSLSGFWILGTGTGTTWSLPLPIPSDRTLVGGRVLCQDRFLDGKLFPAGMVFSNGVSLTLGY